MWSLYIEESAGFFLPFAENINKFVSVGGINPSKEWVFPYSMMPVREKTKTHSIPELVPLRVDSSLVSYGDLAVGSFWTCGFLSIVGILF